MARRGASELKRTEEPERRDEVRRSRAPRPDWQPETWVQDKPTRRVRRPAQRPEAPKTFLPAEPLKARRTPRLPEEVGSELQSAAGPAKAPRLARRLADATRAYERDRYEDARRILKPLSEEAPAAAAVRELHGLTLYRMGRWREAVKELEAFHALTGSFDQHPTMADCQRALGRHGEVDRLWEELGEASPSAELVAEGRIVRAGSMADRGDLVGAIRLLESSVRKVDRPREYHLRLWYALADLYERAGEIPAAREIFTRILRQDRSFFDVAERQAALGG